MNDPKPRPYPTPTRLKLMRRITEDDGLGRKGVKHWHFIKPATYELGADRLVTARVRELVDAGLAEIPAPDDFSTSMVRLTDAGRTYLDTYGSSK